MKDHGSADVQEVVAEADHPLALLIDPPLTPELRQDLVRMWVAVTNAGGAVGFLPPIRQGQVEPVAAALFERLAGGVDHLVIARDGDVLVGWVILERNTEPIVAHWAWVKRLQVDPRRQSRGVGRALMGAVRALARHQLGLEQLYLTVRSDAGLETFYAGLGYREVGRMPRNLRVAVGDARDEIYMVLEPL